MSKTKKLTAVRSASLDEYTCEARSYAREARTLMNMLAEANSDTHADEDIMNVANVTADLLSQAIDAMDKVDAQIAGWRASGQLLDRAPAMREAAS